MIKKLLISSLTAITLSADINAIFITTTLGYTHQSVEQEDKVGAIILAQEPDKDGYNFEIGAGYKLTQELALSLNYQRVNLEDTFSNNAYFSAEYLFVNSSKFTPYLGVNLGYSQLNYSSKPINTKENDFISGSWLTGAKVGVSYPLTSNMEFLVECNYNATDHTTHLESGSAVSELQHKSSQHFNLGVRVGF
jgi:predicted porin